jgi:hypothetical protein
MADMDDIVLLREYVESNSESAFAEIVRRHQPGPGGRPFGHGAARKSLAIQLAFELGSAVSATGVMRSSKKKTSNSFGRNKREVRCQDLNRQK